MLFIIEYDCADYCGPSHYCLVEDINEGRALGKAAGFMQTRMLELYCDEYEEDQDAAYRDICAYNVIGIKPFNDQHECWKYYLDPSQAEFYPKAA